MSSVHHMWLARMAHLAWYLPLVHLLAFNSTCISREHCYINEVRTFGEFTHMWSYILCVYLVSTHCSVSEGITNMTLCKDKWVSNEFNAILFVRMFGQSEVVLATVISVQCKLHKQWCSPHVTLPRIFVAEKWDALCRVFHKGRQRKHTKDKSLAKILDIYFSN